LRLPEQCFGLRLGRLVPHCGEQRFRFGQRLFGSGVAEEAAALAEKGVGAFRDVAELLPAFTGAADCKRAAVFTASPNISPSNPPVTRLANTSPVFTPTRTANSSDESAAFNSSTASTIARPALTARSASSSCASGTPEHRHHRTTDELLHRTSERLDHRSQPRGIRLHPRPHILWIRPFRGRREADDVAEQHGHNPPLLHGRRRGLGERGTTEGAEGKRTGQFLAARRTARHRPSLSRPSLR
jgi:hypothetical protein